MTKNQHDSDNKNSETVIYEGRSVAFYSALVEAWINTRMECDKQILSLSSLALGGLIAIQQKGLGDATSFIVWLCGGVCFVLAILLALIVLSMNAHYIEKLAEDSKSTRHEYLLKLLDIALMILFVFGVVLTFTLAIKETGFVAILKQNN